MITALIKEETSAINTAKPSALKTKLKPSGNGSVIFIIWPETTEEAMEPESAHEATTKINAARFLAFAQTRPTKGRKAAPSNGRNTIKSKAHSLFIFTDICLSIEHWP